MPAAAIASALVLHAVSIGALMAFGYGIPAQPAPAAVVEVAVALELSKPTPVASAPMPEPPVAEPVAPFLPEQPVAVPSPAIATLEPPVPPPVRPQPMRPPTQHAPHTAPAAPRTINMPQDSAANGVSAPSTPTSAGTLASVDQEAALEARIRDAVQAAVRYPPAARMMGVTGRARVRFDYRSGSSPVRHSPSPPARPCWTRPHSPPPGPHIIHRHRHRSKDGCCACWSGSSSSPADRAAG